MTNRLLHYFFLKVDNTPIVIFRIIFGLIMAIESFGAILLGWVDENFILPQHHLGWIWTSWIRPLPGNWMYYYFILMGLVSLSVAIGYKYRFSILLLALLWTGSYFMHKISYNNHHYLMVLICWFMCLISPHTRFSIDSKQQRHEENQMPNCYRLFFILQLLIVFTYAAIAKFSPGWISGDFLSLKFAHKTDYFLIGPLLGAHWFQVLITYSGLVFDMTIIPLLIYSRTRKIAFVLLVIFNLFNSVVFGIGVFPYLVISLAIFFFPPDSMAKLFFPKRIPSSTKEPTTPSRLPLLLFSCYFLVQLYLPLRHHHIAGDVNWTEEGHKLSWRMMLRMRRGQTRFVVKDGKTGERTMIKSSDYLTKRQNRLVNNRPDFIWQFSQLLEEDFLKKGVDSPEVYCTTSLVKVNKGKYKQLIDSTVNLAGVNWNYLGHNDWILD
ncbi:MAG: HTTM domain-containing protein [Reichenbachiella sp.]